MVGFDFLADALFGGDVGLFLGALGGGFFKAFLFFEVFFDVLYFFGGFATDFLQEQSDVSEALGGERGGS